MSSIADNQYTPKSSWMQFRNASPASPVVAPASAIGPNKPDYNFDSYNQPNQLTGQPGYSTSVNTGGGGGDAFDYQGISQGISAVSGLANAYLGFKNLSLSKKQFNFAKDSFNINLANQANLTNQEVVDRETARLAATGRYNNESDLRSMALANVTERGDLVSGAGV